MPLVAFPTPCVVQRTSGHDIYGKPKRLPPVNTRCAVVKLLTKRAKTTVRADSSGTRGHADETIENAKLLLPPGSLVEIDDRMVVLGVGLRVLSVEPMLTVMGKYDHLYVEATYEPS